MAVQTRVQTSKEEEPIQSRKQATKTPLRISQVKPSPQLGRIASKSPVKISQKVMVPLCALMIVFATIIFFEDPPLLATNEVSRLFTRNRMPTGEHFFTYRQATAPMWVYRGLHALPAIIWSIGMPLQHVDSLRKKWPVLHRSAGYVLLSISLLLSITGYWFFISKNAYTHENPFHLHKFKGLPLIAWPTFEVTTWFLAPTYWLTMYKTATTARAKDFVRHRKWAVLHTLSASVISAERLSIVTLNAIGMTMSLLPQKMVHEFFGVGYTIPEIAEAELSVFAFANVLAFIFVLSWLYYEFARAGYFERKGVVRPSTVIETKSTKKDM
ncbi:hypothetical protein BBO_06869 [Beauveria brongniartii RCEF 3172]|uniref:Uncharacterized protein n=1 Tax=Beauveria brongniartii RCEF 3172 TaxID=1081107 RepID=A0A167AKP6_9HYPO|nr:hypothetical protein BBO_06869 [Beauveria brongniartii RCEF 3172]